MSKVGRPLKFKSVKELQDKIDAYFSECEKKSRPLTITGLALALDCDRDTLLNYGKREEYFGTLIKARLMCQNYAEEFLFSGKNVAGAIFNLKNNYSWRDRQEIDHTSKGKAIKGFNYVEPNGTNNSND